MQHCKNIHASAVATGPFQDRPEAQDTRRWRSPVRKPARSSVLQAIDLAGQRGERALFEGLAAETRWDWSRRYPVIRISFSDGMLRSRTELDTRIHEILQDNEIELAEVETEWKIFQKKPLVHLDTIGDAIRLSRCLCHG